jgi:hypothetical protein
MMMPIVIRYEINACLSVREERFFQLAKPTGRAFVKRLKKPGQRNSEETNQLSSEGVKNKIKSLSV